MIHFTNIILIVNSYLMYGSPGLTCFSVTAIIYLKENKESIESFHLRHR